jgi:hypothetical protein
MVKYSTESDGISSDIILDLLMDNKHKVWVAGSVSGLYIIDQNADMVYP